MTKQSSKISCYSPLLHMYLFTSSRAVIHCAETDPAQWITAREWIPRSDSLRGNGSPAVIHCAEIKKINVEKSRAVNHCAETDPPQWITARKRIPRSESLRGNLYLFFYVSKNSSGLIWQYIDKTQIALRIIMVDLSSKNKKIEIFWKFFWFPRSDSLRGNDKNVYNSKNTWKNLKSLKHQNQSTIEVGLTEKIFSKKSHAPVPLTYKKLNRNMNKL